MNIQKSIVTLVLAVLASRVAPGQVIICASNVSAVPCGTASEGSCACVSSGGPTTCQGTQVEANQTGSFSTPGNTKIKVSNDWCTRSRECIRINGGSECVESSECGWSGMWMTSGTSVKIMFVGTCEPI